MTPNSQTLIIVGGYINAWNACAEMNEDTAGNGDACDRKHRP